MKGKKILAILSATAILCSSAVIGGTISASAEAGSYDAPLANWDFVQQPTIAQIGNGVSHAWCNLDLNDAGAHAWEVWFANWPNEGGIWGHQPLWGGKGIKKENNALVYYQNSNDGDPTSRTIRYRMDDHKLGANKGVYVNADSYLTFDFTLQVPTMIRLAFVSDKLNVPNETFKSGYIYLVKNSTSGKIELKAADPTRTPDDSLYLPAGTYTSDGINYSLKEYLAKADPAIVNKAQICALDLWVKESDMVPQGVKITMKNTFRKLSIGNPSFFVTDAYVNGTKATVDNTAKTITAQVSHATDITNLTPVVNTIPGLKLTPSSHDFTSPVTFSGTFNGQKVSYTFTVTKAANTDCDITAAAIGKYVGKIDQTAKRIEFRLPYGTDITSLEPTLTPSAGAKIAPSGAQDFTNPVKYTVTAADGVSVKEYSVCVIIENAPAPVLESVKIGKSVGIINASEKNILFNLPYGTDIKSLTPEFTFSVAGTPDKTEAQDFTKPVKYTFTAPDGKTKTEYTITVNVAKFPEEPVSYYNIDTTVENWEKTGGGETSAPEVKMIYKNNALIMNNSGAHWMNANYMPLKNPQNILKLDTKKANHLFYDISSTAEYWNIIIELCNSEGKISRIDLNKYLAYRCGEANGWNIPEEDGFINFKSHRRFGTFSGKIAVSDLIKWSYEHSASIGMEQKNMMNELPADGILTITNIQLHIDNALNVTNKELIIRTLGFDNINGSNLPKRSSIAGTYRPDFDTESFKVTHPDSTAQVGKVTYENGKLSIEKLGNGWVNFVGAMKSTFNIDTKTGTLSLNYKAEDVHQLHITFTDVQGNALKVNVSAFISNKNGDNKEYLEAGNYKATFKISDLIAFQLKANSKESTMKAAPADGILTVAEVSFNMDGKGNRNLKFDTFEFTTQTAGNNNTDSNVNTGVPEPLAALLLTVVAFGFVMIFKKSIPSHR